MSISVLYLPFKKEFEPIVREGENIAVPIGTDRYEYYKVLWIEPVVITFYMVLDGFAKDVDRSLDELKLEDNQVGQWRMWILDFVGVKMRYPASVSKWGTKGAGEIQMLPLAMAKENVLEFYTRGDDVPIIYVSNPLFEPQVARFAIFGFKYAVEKLPSKPDKYTIFPVYSMDYVVGVRR